MSVDIRLCDDEDVSRLQRFLDRYWAEGHVLARIRLLLDWQHRRADGRLNFILAERDRTDDGVLGVLGFIPTNRYDPALAAAETVAWLALWKVRTDVAPAGLGLTLLRHLTGMYPEGMTGVVGIGPAEHAAMYRALGFTVGELRQYYMLNEDGRDLALAVVSRSGVPSARRSGRPRLMALTSAEAADLKLDPPADRTAPRKTGAYFASRFFDHPVYRYEVFLVEDEGRRALLAVRRAAHDGHGALRIVDFAGPAEVFAGLGPAIQNLVQERNCEYADVWNAGYPADVFEAAGFAPVRPEDGVVIPNYFEPFVRRNGRIAFALRSAGRTPLIFRADGDQDRPNQVPGPA